MGYGVKIVLPSPPNYVTRSPGLEGKSEIQELCLSGNFMVSFDVESLHVLTNIPLNLCNVDLAVKYVSEGKTDLKLSNTRHPNICFTMEKEVDYKIP